MNEPPQPAKARKRRARRGSPPVRRLPLASLRVFVAVAERCSFVQAGQALGVTTSAVTLQIQNLEGYLGAALFLRRGRTVTLTVEGARLLPRIHGSLHEIEAALDDVREMGRRGALKISMLASFLQQWLLPRLPRFRQRHPDIDLRIHTSVELVGFAGQDVQAAIRLGNGTWPGVHSEKLLADWLVPVCTPSMRDRVGWLEDAHDLERFPLLHSLTEPWSSWAAGVDEKEHWPDVGTSFDDSVTVLRAAEGGQGLALTRWSLVAPLIEQGMLVIVSRRIVPSARSYYFVCPEEHLALKKVTALRQWLRTECLAAVAPPGA